MTVKIISLTQPVNPELDAEQLMAYCARVSSPQNQDKDGSKLLKYCISHKHWSVLEMADMTLEITTSRAISAQILRHRSFSFQEFSQRYAETTEFETYEARRQDSKNRQNSIADMSSDDIDWFECIQDDVQHYGLAHYKQALDRGIAKEQARFLLPMSSQTKLYMKGSIRSWVTYCMVRCDKSTQKEHRDIAIACSQILLEEFPLLREALNEITTD